MTGRWKGETVVCVASGPSLRREDVEAARGKARVIVINREFETAPWADALYAADYRFWQTYIADIRRVFRGELWTVDARGAHQYKLNLVQRGTREGLAKEANTVNTGGNSGFQAINLAAQWGAARIVLLGYDMQRTDGKEHHYGKHEGRLPNGVGFKLWIPCFGPLMRDLRKVGVEVWNATRETAIPEDVIPRRMISEALS